MNKAIGYIRVSTNNQDLLRQEVLIKEWCSLNNYELVKICADKLSGTLIERNGYLELLAATKDDTDIIIVSELSRLSRQNDIMRTLTTINEILDKGIDILFLDNERLYKGGVQLELIDIIRIAIEAQNAATERKKIITRMNTGRKVKFAQYDNMCIGKVPFGYDNIPNPEYIRNKTPKSILVRNKDAEVVKDMYRWIIEGKKLKEIAAILQARGIKTKTGKDFDTNSVMNIIHSPKYKGEWVFSGNIKQGDAIVSQDIWQQAQDCLKSNRINEIIKGVNYNPLKGILKCPCGKGMYIVHNYKYYQYRCAIKKNKYDETICNNGGIDFNIVVPACVWAIKHFIHDETFNTRTHKEIIKINNEIELKDNLIKELESNINDIRKQQELLSNNLLRITNPNLILSIEREYNKLDNEIEETNKHIGKLKSEKIELVNLKRTLKEKNIDNEIDEMTLEEKAKLFQRYLQKVVYYSEVRHRGFLVVTFKNGIEIPFIVLARKNTICACLHTFSYDVEERKLTNEVFERPASMNDFRINPIKRLYTTYDVMELYKDIVEENNIFRKMPEFELC